jgi:hypothetical protein
VTVIWHWPEDERVHVAGLGRVMLPVPNCANVTTPEGDTPLTVAVHVADEPPVTEDREQTTEVDEGAATDITETVPEPELVTNTSPLPKS